MVMAFKRDWQKERHLKICNIITNQTNPHNVKSEVIFRRQSNDALLHRCGKEELGSVLVLRYLPALRDVPGLGQWS